MIRYSNRCKCLLCYLLAFALPLLWLAAAVWFLYPCRLAGTAPNVAANLLSLCPGLEKLLPSLTQTAQLCAVPEGLGGQAFRVALVARERVWLAFTTGCALLVWGLTLLVQLGWRVRFSSAVGAASQTGRAIRSYRLRMILLAGINGLMAALVWLAGVLLETGGYGMFSPIFCLIRCTCWPRGWSFGWPPRRPSAAGTVFLSACKGDCLWAVM